VRRLVVALVAAAAIVVAAVGIMVAIDRAFFSQRAQVCASPARRTSRPAMQRILEGVVGGPSELAPGATAYVSGPDGNWLGAAGVADTSTCARMPTDARMRLESVSKIYTAALILQLAQSGKLRVGDTVADWLPGLLPYGNRITIRHLLTMSSGLIDNNDLRNAPASVQRMDLARVKDVKRGRNCARPSLVSRRIRRPSCRRASGSGGQPGSRSSSHRAAGFTTPTSVTTSSD
jgi:CubicO group peptidase (beta-lactamase class C family)